MPKQDYLVQLIKTLSPGEQRWFRLFSDLQAGEKKYVRLFEILQSKDSYQVGELVKELKVTTNQLAVLKHYLLEALLSCLRINSEQTTNADTIYNGLTDARGLVARRLSQPALDMIEKNLDLAWKTEQFEALDDLLKIKWTCLLDLQEFKKLQQLHMENEKLAAIMFELNELTHLRTLSGWYERKRGATAEVKKLLSHPLLKKKPEALLSLRAQITWFSIKNDCRRIGPIPGENDLLAARREWDFYKKRPHIKTVQGMAYVVCYTQLVRAEAEAENHEQALKILVELEQLIDNRGVQLSKARAASVKSFIYNWRMILFQAEGLFAEILQEIEKVAPLIKSRTIFEQLEVNFSHAVALVHLKRSREAVAKLDEILRMKLPVDAPLVKGARILLIIAQLDMGNYEVLPYLIKSSKTWMKRNRNFDADDETFFKYISEALNPQALKLQQQAYHKLLAAVKDGKLEKINSDCSLDYWLERKVKKSSKNT